MCGCFADLKVSAPPIQNRGRALPGERTEIVCQIQSVMICKEKFRVGPPVRSENEGLPHTQ